MGNSQICTFCSNKCKDDHEYSIQSVEDWKSQNNHIFSEGSKAKHTMTDNRGKNYFSTLLSDGGNINNNSIIKKYYLSSDELNRIIKLQSVIKMRYYRKKLEKLQVDESTNICSSAPHRKKRRKVSDSDSNFIGNKNKGMKEGFGILGWKDGSMFIGIFKRNVAHGIGILRYSQNEVYSGIKSITLGEFENDRANGYGTYSHQNGAFYEGQWKNDFQEKIGIEVWTDGSVFKGLYEKGMKNGIGDYNWCDGSRYMGDWKDNCLHGYVKLYNIREFIISLIREFILVNGFTTQWMDMGNSIGMMVKCI